jgi:hypothetical protein
VLDTAVQHYQQQQAIGRLTITAAGNVWANLDPANLDRSWAALNDRMLATVASGQMLAAQQADPYLTAVLTEQGIDAAADGTVVPRAFAGIASDGRSLDTLLYEPVIAVKSAIGRGAPVDRAMGTGAASLQRIVGTQVADAGRTAVGAGTVARRHVEGHVRVLSPPSCGRCAVLAGRWYRWSAGFARHPHCDCQMLPSSHDRADDLTTDPRAYFDRLSSDDQAKYFGTAEAQAIRDGADIGRVVNAARGTYTAGARQYTRELGRSRRLTPEQIYRDARGDRESGIRLLREHGYLTGTPRRDLVPERVLGEVAIDGTPAGLFAGENAPYLEAWLHENAAWRQAWYAEHTPAESQVASALFRRWDDDIAGWDTAWEAAPLPVRNPLRRVSAEQSLREEYDLFVDAQYVDALDVTNGNLLSKEGQAASAKGSVDDYTVFSGKLNTRHVSEELLRYWQDHPRLTFQQFKAQAHRRAGDVAAAEGTASRMNSIDTVRGVVRR